MTLPLRKHENLQRPLTGILVLDFSQFLSGSLATLRLADLGARVIKIERPGTGDLGRSLYLSDTDVHGENTLFHAINRSKESYAADLKSPSDLQKLRHLITRADVMVQNFRPGVMDRLGLGYESVSKMSSRLVYGVVSGYGNAEAWQDLPGQDGMLLFVDHGIFMEFMPVTEYGKKDPETIGLQEVELGKNYALIISTNGGLWRYMIGDTIRFTSLNPYHIKVSGRLKHYINAFGEEVIVDNTDKAIAIASEKTGAIVNDYTAAPV